MDEALKSVQRSGVVNLAQGRVEDAIVEVRAVGSEVEPAGPFWEAEPEHQDLERYPNGYT